MNKLFSQRIPRFFSKKAGISEKKEPKRLKHFNYKSYFVALQNALQDLNREINKYREAERITFDLYEKFRQLEELGIPNRSEFIHPPLRNYEKALKEFETILEQSTNSASAIVLRYKYWLFFRKNIKLTRDLIIILALHRHNIKVPLFLEKASFGKL